jgi:hypothetical protein
MRGSTPLNNARLAAAAGPVRMAILVANPTPDMACGPMACDHETNALQSNAHDSYDKNNTPASLVVSTACGPMACYHETHGPNYKQETFPSPGTVRSKILLCTKKRTATTIDRPASIQTNVYIQQVVMRETSRKLLMIYSIYRAHNNSGQSNPQTLLPGCGSATRWHWRAAAGAGAGLAVADGERQVQAGADVGDGGGGRGRRARPEFEPRRIQAPAH